MGRVGGRGILVAGGWVRPVKITTTDTDVFEFYRHVYLKLDNTQPSGSFKTR